ncbi:MAG: hypothetical protein K9H26_19165, partial [Prolixibacteraceae bacterium]|nr:hypothetical protein [Prolixibacteraceae bacterium]
FSDTDGYYFYDFYNDSSRTYTVFASKTENYFYDYGTIVEGKKNRIDLSLKPFKKLYLKCINQSNKFNRIHIVNLENTYQTENFYDNNFKNCEAVFHIIPEKNVNIVIKLQHINELNEICNNHTAKLDFFAGKNDTTITCYY